MPPRKNPVSRKKKTTPRVVPHYLPYRYITPLRPQTPLPPPKKTLLEKSQNVIQKIKPYVAIVTFLIGTYIAAKQLYGIGKNASWLSKKIRPADVSKVNDIIAKRGGRFELEQERRRIQKDIDTNAFKKSNYPILTNAIRRIDDGLRDHNLRQEITKENRKNILRKENRLRKIIPATPEELEIIKEQGKKSRQRLLNVLRTIPIVRRTPVTKSPKFLNANDRNFNKRNLNENNLT